MHDVEAVAIARHVVLRPVLVHKATQRVHEEIADDGGGAFVLKPEIRSGATNECRWDANLGDVGVQDGERRERGVVG